ncbi:hypothetical protein DFR90_000153 [Clostridium beijerinckii]|nr:hypothetical protein [Clostridium beijerinckii]
MRKDYEVISNGSIKFILEENNKVLSYVRNLGDATVLVINNFYGESAKVEIPDEYADKSAKSKILISNYKDSSVLNKELNLRPFESIVYHI